MKKVEKQNSRPVKHFWASNRNHKKLNEVNSRVSTTISKCYSLFFPFNIEKNICKAAKILEAWNSALQELHLTRSWRKPLSYRNQSIDLQSNDNGLHHERVESKSWNYCFTPTEFLTALFLKKSIERNDCNKFIKILRIYLLELSTL